MMRQPDLQALANIIGPRFAAAAAERAPAELRRLAEGLSNPATVTPRAEAESMLGKLVADSGAAQRITDALIKLFGRKYMLWGLALAGFVIGIPLFYNAGFMIVIPLIFMISSAAKIPMLVVAVPMLSA